MPIDQPLMQAAMLVAGLGFLWWEIRSIRRKVAANWADREMILAHRFKMLLTSVLLAVVGALLLLQSAGVISASAARQAMTATAFLTLLAALYFLVRKAPNWVWRWLGPS